MPVKKVVVYSTSSCPWCHKAKEWLTQHKIPYTDINVGSNTKAAHMMIQKSGQTGVPVIEVGKEIIVGFDESKLRKALL